MKDSKKEYHCEKIFAEKILQLFLSHYLLAFFCIQSIKLQFVNDQRDFLSLRKLLLSGDAAHEGQQWSDLCWNISNWLRMNCDELIFVLKIQLILEFFS